MAALLLALGGGGAKAARAQDMILQLDPAGSKIAYSLDATLHTVHGTFQLRSGMVRFNPASGAANGLIVVDAASGNSGNQTRDRRMHKDVLQSKQYPEITFTPNHISGEISPEGISTVQMQGVFRLHGGDHPITLTAPVQIEGNILRTTIHMVIPYVAWGLKNPSNFFLRVSDTVTLEITVAGRLSSAHENGAH